VGVAWASTRDASSVLIVLGDQPLISIAHVNALIAQSERKAIVASRYAGHFGPPVVFDSSHFADLLHLSGDEGARGLLERKGERPSVIDWPGGAVDLDTPTDVERFRAAIAYLAGSAERIAPRPTRAP
jgi:molybdenum cofactor cytidylyltransferase